MVKRKYIPRSYLEKIAQECNLSADELADIAGLHRNTVQSLFAEPTLPDGVKLGTLRKLASALNISIAQLLNGHESEAPQ